MVYHSVDHSIEWKIWPNPPKIKNAKQQQQQQTEELSLEDINANSFKKTYLNVL